MSNRLDFVTGAYYFNETANTGLNVPSSAAFPFGFYVPGTIIQQQHENNQTYGFFGDFTVHLTDVLRLVAAVRYSHDAKNINVIYNNPGGAQCVNPQEVNTSSVNPKFAVEYDVSARILLYAQYSRGVKPAGMNTVCGAIARFLPEKLTSYEIGAKSTLLENRLTMNLSAFHYNYRNYQIFSLVGFQGVINNAPEAKTDGAELDLRASLASHLRANLSLAFLNAHYTKFDDADPNGIVNSECLIGAFAALGFPAGPCIAGVSGIPPDVQHLAGKKLNRAPDFTGSVGVEGDLGLGSVLPSSSLTWRVEAYVSAAEYFRQFNTYFDRQGGYAIGNAFLTLNTAADKYSIRAFVKNFTDKPYALGRTSNPGIGTSFVFGEWGAPRTWGLELSARF
jgi:iron complex outermembrane receptor protein